MNREEAYNRIDAIIAKYEIDEEYVTITSALDYDALRMARKALEQQSCGDVISRQAVIEITAETGALETQARVKALSLVTPQPKTGHWIAQDIHNCHTDFKCSECGYIHSFMHIYGEPTADYTYCPNCGCRMVEPQESEKV